jgi:5,10-methylenetetrahydromethanopterin reductase
MPTKSRVGLCFLDRPGAQEQIKYAQMADQMGYDTIWICETRLARDAISILGGIAATTRNIKLGSNVVNSWTRPASLMALTFATLQELSGGRTVCGIGAYWDPLAWKQGIERKKPLRQMREYVHVVRALLNLERVTYEGELVHVRDLELDLGHGVPRNPLHVPIFIGATGPQMLELAGEIADGVALNGNVSVEYTRDAIQHIRKGAERAGRKLSDLEFPILLSVSMDKDGDKARDEARRLITMYLAQQPHVGKASGLPVEYVDRLTETMGGWPPSPGGVEAAMRLVGDDIVNMLAVAGTPDEVLARARQYVDAGATYVSPMTWSDNVPEILELFSQL